MRSRIGLLLELDSELNTGMCFSYAGRIHFMIRKQVPLLEVLIDRVMESKVAV